METKRWPRWVYGVGAEPDPRFTLANERTFLAWIRTSLAVLAVGIAAEALSVPEDVTARRVVVVVSVLLGAVTCASAFFRWSRTERALRRNEPLPGQALGPTLCLGLVVVGVVLLSGLAR